MSAAIKALSDLRHPDGLSFVGPGSRSSPTRDTCGRWVRSAAYGHLKNDGKTYCLRRMRLGCGRYDCPSCYPQWASTAARRVRPRDPANVLVHVQLLPLNLAASTSEELEDLFDAARKVCRQLGTRGTFWIHATGHQEIRGVDQVVDECTDELHVHALVETPRPFGAPAVERAIRTAGGPFGAVVFHVRRCLLVRTRDTPELLVRSSRPPSTNRIGARVLRSWGSRGGKKAPKPVPAAPDAPTSAPESLKAWLIVCPGCGEAHAKVDFGWYKPIDPGGRPLELPWDDDEDHAVTDGESGIYWMRADPLEVILRA